MNRPFTMAAEGLERYRFSVSDIDRMTDAGVLDSEGSWELIDGEIVPMAAQHTSHGRMAFRLAKWIDSRVDQKLFEVYAGVTVELDQFTRVDPDICVAKSNLTTKALRASDVFWVLEVSEATRRKDVKAPLYAAAGIPEYWVVDLESRLTHLHRGPSASGWREIVRVNFDQPASPTMFPALKIALAALSSTAAN